MLILSPGVMFVGICNPDAVNIRICNPKKTSYRHFEKGCNT